MANASHNRTLWLIAGPDGVGKTSYAFRHIGAVSGSTRFVNLDEIARGLSPLDPAAEQRRAARVALGLADDLIRSRLSFSLETTLAGRTHLRTIERARAAGFRVTLLYFAVAAVEVSLARIARRVSEGGHDVPEADARRRFMRSQANFEIYAGLADLWRVFDNNGPAPATAAEGAGNCVTMRGEAAGLPPRLAAVLAALPDCAPASRT